MESRNVKEILNDLSSLLGEIADLKDGENYPITIDGVATTESALERAKTLANVSLENNLYELFELLGLEEDWTWIRVKKKTLSQ